MPSRVRRPRRRAALLASLLAAALSFASAQVCHDELARVQPEAGTPPGVVAAELLAAAVELAEPALPPLRAGPAPSLPEGAGTAARFLAERELLPEAWRPDALTAPVWQVMLDRFLAWYEAGSVTVSGPLEPEPLRADLERALARVREAVRPVALVAAAEEERNRVAFLGLVHNWSVYPRLIVLRPGEGETLAGGVEGALARLSTCAVPVEDWVYAPEATARRLFLGAAEARMYVVGSDPKGAWPLLVAEGEETAYFAFDHPDVAHLDAFSAVFSGPSAGPAALVRLLPSVRSNLGPRGVLRLFEIPSHLGD